MMNGWIDGAHKYHSSRLDSLTDIQSNVCTSCLVMRLRQEECGYERTKILNQTDKEYLS